MEGRFNMLEYRRRESSRYSGKRDTRLQEASKLSDVSVSLAESRVAPFFDTVGLISNDDEIMAKGMIGKERLEVSCSERILGRRDDNLIVAFANFLCG